MVRGEMRYSRYRRRTGVAWQRVMRFPRSGKMRLNSPTRTRVIGKPIPQHQTSTGFEPEHHQIRSCALASKLRSAHVVVALDTASLDIYQSTPRSAAW